MAYPFSLAENFKLVSATPLGAQTTNGGIAAFRPISLRHVHKVWLVAVFQQDGAHATTIQPLVGATVATANAAITFAARNWRNADVATTDTLVELAAATTCACTNAATDQMLVIEIDPADVIMQNATFDCLGASIAAGAGAGNFVGAVWVCAMRYEQATPPSVIVD